MAALVAAIHALLSGHGARRGWPARRPAMTERGRFVVAAPEPVEDGRKRPDARGHPRLTFWPRGKTWMAGTEAGHDSREGGLSWPHLSRSSATCDAARKTRMRG